MTRVEPSFFALLCAGSTLGAWVYFTFLGTPAPGDPAARVMFAAGVGALLIALASSFGRREPYVRTELIWHSTMLAVMLAIVAASIGRVAQDLAGLGTFVGAFGAALGGVKYFSDKAEARRKEERAERRRRHASVMAEWGAFVANDRLVSAIRILEYEEPELQQLAHPVSLKEYRNWKNGIDQILEFLLRLAYAVKVKELDEEPVREAVGWYLRRVASNIALREYCEQHGYALVVEFAQGRATVCAS